MLRDFTNLPIYFSLFFFSSTNFAAYGSQTLAYKFNIFCHRMSHLTGMIFVSNIFHFSLHDLLSGFRFFSKYFQIFCNMLKSRSFFSIYLLNYVEFFDVISSEVPYIPYICDFLDNMNAHYLTIPTSLCMLSRISSYRLNRP